VTVLTREKSRRDWDTVGEEAPVVPRNNSSNTISPRSNLRAWIEFVGLNQSFEGV